MSRQRLSMGGHAVADSLAAVGMSVTPPTVSLVETALPLRSPFLAVLAQNAWCVIGRAEFRDRAHPYPARIVVRHRLRRLLAEVNLRRTAHPMALSYSMGEVMRSRGLDPTVCPVTLPMDYLDPQGEVRPPWLIGTRPFVLIPGAVTWYKNTQWVVDLVDRCRRLGTEVPLIVLAGGDDGSGCLDHIFATAGHDVVQRTVERREMRWLLRNASAVVLPTQLESLSFSLAEALSVSMTVMASAIPVHREVAQRIGREPLWLSEDESLDTVIGWCEQRPSVGYDPGLDLDALEAEWRVLRGSIERFGQLS